MNITWQSASHEKITITKDYIRIKVGLDGDKYRGVLISIAEQAFKDYIESGMEFTVRGILEKKEGSCYLRFESQHGHNSNRRLTWKSYHRSI